MNPGSNDKGALFDLRPESMTILKRVTDIIAHKKCMLL